MPIRDSQGNLVRWFGTNTDISAQIAAEEQIRNLNAQLQERVAELEAIMQVLPVGVAVSQDPESTVVTANLALSNLLGVNPGENIAVRRFARFKVGDVGATVAATKAAEQKAE